MCRAGLPGLTQPLASCRKESPEPMNPSAMPVLKYSVDGPQERADDDGLLPRAEPVRPGREKPHGRPVPGMKNGFLRGFLLRTGAAR